MTNESPTPAEEERRHLFAWILFPLALFPLVALMTYDARTYTEIPHAPSTNWIGALGDTFAHYGYALFGLAIWIVPVLCVIGGICLICGRRMRPGRRELWFLVLLAALSCILQVISSHGGALTAVAHRINIADVGGALGYIIMTRTLAPLLSDFGASVLMAILFLIALVGAVGAHNLVSLLAKLLHWASVPEKAPSAYEQSNSPFPGTSVPAFDPREAARQAKEEARRQREEEKQRIREKKLREKEAARAEREAAKSADEAVRIGKDAAASTEAPRQSDDRGPYMLPPLSLLNPLKASSADHGDVGEMTKKLIDTLKLFGVEAQLAYTVQGPVVTKYAIRLAPGTRYSSVTNISDNLMGALRAKSLRIEAPIPCEENVGIEVPNRASAGISFREIVESDAWRNFKGELPLLFGKDAAGRELVADLAKMPHMLVAGATGQGKSVCLNAIINGLLMTKTPEQLKLIMVDPKSVEFTSYVSIPHLIVPIITDNRKVVYSLHWAVAEMEKRLKLFQRAKVRNIYDFNHRPSFTQTDMFGDDTTVGSDMPKTVPYIVIIIDEVADLMSSNGKEVTPDIARLTAKARAAGIHLILATQRPDAKIITGTIKANIPGRVAFKTATAIDSRTILDDSGAENLIGKGDMLFRTADGILVRAQGAWISDPEIERITAFIEQHSTPQFDDKFKTKLDRVKEAGIADPFADNEDDPDNKPKGGGDDDMPSARDLVKAEESASDFKKAIECVINTNRASISHFQRRLGWGYNHAAKIMDMLEDAGVIGPQVGAGPRPIIMDQNQLMALFQGGASAVAPGGAAEPSAQSESVETDEYTSPQE